MLSASDSASFTDIVLWSNKKKSAKALISALFSWYFLFQAAQNYFTTVSRVLHLLLILGGLHRFGVIKLSVIKVEQHFRRVADAISGGIRFLIPLVRWEKPKFSILVWLIALVFSLLGHCCRYDNGVLILILLVFSVPFVLSQYTPFFAMLSS